jgi:hypothetical protein
VTDARKGWQDALSPSPECIDIARFGEELDAASTAHVQSCPRCEAELALFREFETEDRGAEEVDAGQWVAAELQRRFDEPARVLPFRTRAMRALVAAAAAVLIVAGGSYWLQMREPSIDGALGDGPAVYRNTSLEVLSPAGDLPAAPNELRWTAVPLASEYRVKIVEVDGTPVWSAVTSSTQVVLPPAVIAQFAPGKSLSWDVKAFRGDEMLASSETQVVRVSGSPHRKER